MAEQTFRSAGYFEREIDVSAPTVDPPVGTPATIIGTSEKGPAFVPITVRDFDQFQERFGAEGIDHPSVYAAKKFLENSRALTFLKVLGAGVLDDASSIAKYRATGQTKNAGFVVTGTVADSLGRHKGAVQFIGARHALRTNEAYGMPMFSDNRTYDGTQAYLVRGEVMCGNNVRVAVLDGNEALTASTFTATAPDDLATVVSGKIKLVLSSSDASFGTADGLSGLRVYSASLNPSDKDYFGKILNKDPNRFAEFGHLLYADYPVDDEVATATFVSVLSGSLNISSGSGDTSMQFRDAFGHFDTKYACPSTPSFISQPFGKTEYDLFRVESLDDGEYANTLYKISIADLRASLDESDPYGTFTVQIRDWSDSDLSPKVIESFSQCNLNPTSENYVARKIGDRKVSFLFDAENPLERRLSSEGKFENQSNRIRVVMADAVERREVPAKALPFGFRGHSLLKTNDSSTDRPGPTTAVRLAGQISGSTSGSILSGAVLPPVPYRFKITRGEVATSGFAGNPGPLESTNGNLYWGVKFERNTEPLNANLATEKNGLIEAYTKFAGIAKLDVLLTGSAADQVNDNKFTLARVALANTAVAQLTGTVDTHMREAAYLRNATPDASTYAVSDGTISNRLSLASLLADSSPNTFNRFSKYAKFATFMQGGFNGTNILDREDAKLSDEASSFAGNAAVGNISAGLAVNVAGETSSNNAVQAYRMATEIATEKLATRSNIISIPGIREPFITDYLLKKVQEYDLAVCVLDLENYDENGNRLFAGSSVFPDVDSTSSAFSARAIDNNSGVTYFPDIIMQDETNRRRVKAPASVAALGAYSYNDKFAKPWFAPAGFNRGSLDYVKNVSVKLSQTDMETLSDARINPISTFPKDKFVIYGQKNLQVKNSAMNRVNVKRLTIEVKRGVISRARLIVFDNNTPDEIASFRKDVEAQLAIIKAQFGIEEATIIIDSRNNTEEDANNLTVRGTIQVVPTRTAENIAIDFYITRSGVIFT